MDQSSRNILKKLATPRDPKVTTAHAGVQSVSTDGGTKPTQPRTDDGNVKANAKFNAGAVGASETTDPAKLIGAGIVKGN
jgi:hypothetical protein